MRANGRYSTANERVVSLSWMMGSQHERKETRQLARKETRILDNGLTIPRYGSKKVSQLHLFDGCFHDILISIGECDGPDGKKPEDSSCAEQSCVGSEARLMPGR
jgi:hypothetical protein